MEYLKMTLVDRNNEPLYVVHVNWNNVTHVMELGEGISLIYLVTGKSLRVKECMN